jgi:anti-sigma regulatory factor (Ser/Thr protein kinase)/HAMP domain-containing protein
MSLPRAGLRGKLMMGTGVLVIVAVLMALAIFRSAQAELETQAFESLHAIRESKATQIESTMDQIGNEVATIAENRVTGESINDFTVGFKAISPSKADAKAASKRVDEYYESQFLPRVQTVPGDPAPKIKQFRPDSDAAITLQDSYIASNPFPVGDKDALTTATNAPTYDAAHLQNHPTFRSVQRSSGFYDLFLIDNDGNVVYSVFKEIDYGTNLLTGPHKDSGLGQAFREAKANPGEVAVTDFDAYQPSYNAQAAFFATTVSSGSEDIGVLAVQAPVDEINDVMTSGERWEDVGLGESGETYIVADDFTMRNDSRFLVEDRSSYFAALIADPEVSFEVVKAIDRFDSSIGLQPVLTEGAKAAIEGNEGEAVFKDYRDVSVLSSYRPLVVEGENWAIMSEIDEAEAFGPVSQLRNRSLVLILIGGAALMIAMFIFSGRLARPLRQLSGVAEDLSGYDFTSDKPYVSEELTTVTKRQDEIGELAQAFRNMSGELSTSVRETFDAVEARKSFETELNIATDIQASMLPLIFPEFPEITEFDIHARLVPATEVGGDFYEFGFIDENHFFFCVGDVSGKGVPAALFMAATKTLIRSGALQGLPPGDLLTRVNDELARENPEFMFATVWLGVLDLRNGIITFTNAGHNPPFLRSSDVAMVEQLHGPMIGPIPGSIYGQDQLLLGVGDLLTVYSDGVTEAMDPDSVQFGEGRLEDTITESEPIVTEITEAVEAATLAWEQGDRSDDLTVLAIQFLSPRRIPTFEVTMPTQGELSDQIAEDIHLLNESFGRFAESRGVEDSIVRPLQVAVDEMLVNIATHSGAESVVVRAWLDDGELLLEISDDGTPFNPFADAATPDLAAPLDEREIGGLGIHLVRSLLDEVDYASRGGRNFITLTKKPKEES